MSLWNSWTGGAVSGAASVLIAGVVSATAGAQQTGKVTGRVIDAQTGAGLSDVGIQVVGTTIGTLSGVDGRFTIPNVATGTVTLQARRIGYQPKSVTGLQLASGQTLVQDVSLAVATTVLSATVVTASAERGSVNSALDRQRTSTSVVNSVTSEQIQKSPDSDAAQAVGRVSGVTVQDGKYVFVRGLGERYTTTSLNGARIPSPEPERKVVPLDLFPAGLLQTITTSKTFTPDQAGDFSGASVNIETREFPARRVVSYSSSIGINDAVSGQQVLRAPTTGLEWLGFAGSERSLPGALRGAGGFTVPSSRSEGNLFGRSFRNVWSAGRESGAPNYSLSASMGGQDPVFGHAIGYVGSLSYALSQEVRAGEIRSTTQPGQNSEPLEVNRFEGSTGRQSVLLGGLFNLSTLVGTRTRVALNNTYSRTADNEARVDEGLLEKLGGGTLTRRTQLKFVERSIRSNQLRAEHSIGTRHNFDVNITSSGVARREPDRADLAYVRQDLPAGGLGPFALLEDVNDAARRTFSELKETSIGADLNYSIAFGQAEQSKLKFGGSFRSTNRDALLRQYSLRAIGGALSAEQRSLPAEQLFDGRYLQDSNNVFDFLQTSAGGSYDASDRVAAGFAMADYVLSDRIRVVGGARVEQTDLRVTSEQTSGEPVTSRLDNVDVLPSLAVNVKVTETGSLRLSATQTLSRPEYRELSPVSNPGLIGEGIQFGNADLRRSLIQNYDARYEWYPNAGEVLSVGVFAKRFQDPIERVEVATSGEPQTTWVNTDGAENLGVEAEVRKGLGAFWHRFEPLTVFANATVMRSEIRPGNGTLSALTNSKRPMVGQAPYVVNTGITYASSSGRASATVLYNRVGERVVTAATSPIRDDLYEQPRNVLDISLRFPVAFGFAAKIDARNILDAEYLVKQGPVTRERYTTGRVLGVGVSWNR